MNRVIPHSQIGETVTYFGGQEPHFVDERVTALLDQARAEGYAQGLRDGAEAAAADAVIQVDRIAAAIQAAAAETRTALSAAASASIENALAIAEFIVGAISLDHDEMARRIAQALDTLDDEEIVVTISPSDFAGLVETLELPPGVILETHERLQHGEVKIAGKWSAIDMTRNAALDVVREVLE